MATKNLHDHPFDEGTLIKLEIFEDYLKEWFPTFVMSHADSDIWIFDFSQEQDETLWVKQVAQFEYCNK